MWEQLQDQVFWWQIIKEKLKCIFEKRNKKKRDVGLDAMINEKMKLSTRVVIHWSCITVLIFFITIGNICYESSWFPTNWHRQFLHILNLFTRFHVCRCMRLFTLLIVTFAPVYTILHNSVQSIWYQNFSTLGDIIPGFWSRSWILYCTSASIILKSLILNVEKSLEKYSERLFVLHCWWAL